MLLNCTYNISLPQSILTNFFQKPIIKCPNICGRLSMNSESLEILSTSQVDKDMMRLKVLFPRNSHSLDLSRKSVDYA